MSKCIETHTLLIEHLCFISRSYRPEYFTFSEIGPNTSRKIKCFVKYTYDKFKSFLRRNQTTKNIKGVEVQLRRSF